MSLYSNLYAWPIKHLVWWPRDTPISVIYAIVPIDRKLSFGSMAVWVRTHVASLKNQILSDLFKWLIYQHQMLPCVLHQHVERGVFYPWDLSAVAIKLKTRNPKRAREEWGLLTEWQRNTGRLERRKREHRGHGREWWWCQILDPSLLRNTPEQDGVGLLRSHQVPQYFMFTHYRWCVSYCTSLVYMLINCVRRSASDQTWCLQEVRRDQ